MQHPTVFGMVTTRRSEAYTHLAVRSFFQTTDLSAQDRFILIDNDNCWDRGRACYDVISPWRPYSFAENANEIIAIADSMLADVVFLNNDIYFTNGWSRGLEQQDGIVLPSCNQTHELEYKGFRAWGTMFMTWQDGHIENHLACLDHMAMTHTRELAGHKFQRRLMPLYAFKIPRWVYQEVGRMDEAFGPGGAEDVDYRLRAILHGIPCYYTCDSWLLHFHGKSTWAVETQQEQQARDNEYLAHFHEKWGSKMWNLTLAQGDWQQVLRDHDVPDPGDHADWDQTIRKIYHA